MGHKSEFDNIGFEDHPMFSVYENNMFEKEGRCYRCGGTDTITHTYEIWWVDYCNDCQTDTMFDKCSFIEWCEAYGYNPNNKDVIEIFEDTDKTFLAELIKTVDCFSDKISIVGVNNKQNTQP